MWIALLILLSIISLIFFYRHLCRELKEIDPVLLNHQTSISETRKSSESAIYRSVDVPHGVTVTRGLNLRSGYKIRDGCLKDIWYIALDKRRNSLDKSKICLGDHKYSIGEVNTLIHLIASKLGQFKDVKKIAIFGDLVENPELLLVIWSCFFVTDITVILCRSSNDLKVAKDEECDIVFAQSTYARHVPIDTFKEVIGLSLADDDLVDVFTQTITIPQNIVAKNDYIYNPDEDFAKVNNNPYSIVSNGHEMRYFQVNFVSAVASKIMSIPNALTWGKTDNVLISYTKKNFTSTNIIFGTCCAFLSDVETIEIVNPEKMKTLKEISMFKPTILFIDSHIMKTLCNSSKKSFWQSYLLQRSEYFNSLGYFNSFGKIEKSLNLKLIYMSQLNPVLSSFICNFCKSMLGSRIVREVYTDFSIGPILKTNIYDFRIVQNKSMALLGVPANSVELKTINSSEEENIGKLLCRGMSIGKGDHVAVDEEEFWVDTGIEGIFARDGCFYGNL